MRQQTVATMHCGHCQKSYNIREIWSDNHGDWCPDCGNSVHSGALELPCVLCERIKEITKGVTPMDNPTTKQARFTVYLHDLHIDTVFFTEGTTREEVKRSLVEHDQYNPNIEVFRG